MPSPGVYAVGAIFNIGGVTGNPPICLICFPVNISSYTVACYKHTSAVNITQEYMQVNCVVMRDGTGDGLGMVEIPFPNLQII